MGDTRNAHNLIARHEEYDQARILANPGDRRQTIQRITLNLATAKAEHDPYIIRFPFKSLFIAEATDTSSKVYLKPGTLDDHQDSMPLSLRDSWGLDYPINPAALFWDAQPGKTMQILFFLDSKFVSGSIVSRTSGGVSISEGESVSAPSSVTLIAATAAAIVPQNLNRKVATIQNKTTAGLYIGDSTVTNTGATEGIEIPIGGIIEWKNTGALYGYSVGGGKVTYIEET